MSYKYDSHQLDHRIFLTLIELVAGLSARSKMRADLTNAFLDELWDSLQHSSLSYMGEKFIYRSIDGSYNVSGSMMQHLSSINEL